MVAETAICMTSRDRPHLIPGLIANLRETTRDNSVRILWTVDDAESKRILDEAGEEAYLTAGSTAIAKINAMAVLTSLSGEPYFYWGADDTKLVQGWLDNALTVVKENNGVVGLNDGHGCYDTQIISRDYINEYGTIESPGLVMHPGYKHYCCEVELFQTAKMRRRLGYASNEIVIHNHWARGLSPKDTTYKRALNWGPADHDLFRSRAHLWGGSTEHLGRPGSGWVI